MLFSYDTPLLFKLLRIYYKLEKSICQRRKTMICNICPRECGIDRKTEKGICGCGENMRISRAAPHFWEEPPISHKNGSGTVFFAGCNLKCVFCQNREISRCETGKEITADRLYEIFTELKALGVHNINLVTPTHYTDTLAKAIDIAKHCEAWIVGIV